MDGRGTGGAGRPAWFVAAALATAAAGPAAAQPARALIVGPPDAAVIAPLEDEVRALGMEVRVIPSDVLPSWRVLRDLARSRDATAAIAVAPQGSEIEIWVVDRATGKASVRGVAVPLGDPEDVARVAAVRAVELLRVSLREIGRGPPPPEAEVEVPAEVRALLEEEPARLWLGLGGGALWAPGGLEPTALLAAAVRYQALDRLSLAIAVSFPLTDGGLSAAEGSADVRPWWTFVEVRWTPLGDRGLLVPDLGAGLGAVAVTMRGAAREPFVGNDDIVAAFAWHAVAGVEIRPLRRLAVRLDAWCGTTAPEIGVRFGDRRVATWGLPLLGGALTLGVGW